MSSGWRSAPPPPPPPPMPRRVEHPFWSRVLDAVALFFSGFCHTLGAAFLRLLSTIVLVGGIAGSVALNIMGYYYLGVLNPHPLLAALLYVPTLAALALLREEMLKNGTSESGFGASRDSHAAALSYLLMIGSGTLSVMHPVWMRGGNYISSRSMWTCIGATSVFFFALLFSSLAYASALNIFLSGKREFRSARGEPGGVAGDYDYVVHLPPEGSAASAAAAAAAGQPLPPPPPPPPPPDVYGDGPPPGPYDVAVLRAGGAAPGGAIDTFYK